jgi:pullulanase
MLKRILSTALALVLCFTLALPAFAAGKTTVVIHYQQAKDNVLDWNLWLWADGGNGSVYLFNGEDAFGKVATHELNGDIKKLGFIVRTDNWDKDVAEDRFVEVANGKVEIWLKSGDATIYTSNPDGDTAVQPTAMPKTGMGGASEPVQNTNSLFAAAAVLAIVLTASYVVLRKKKFN